MGCQCVKKRITYSCLHQDSRMETCWRDAWRRDLPCLGVFVPRCDSPVKALRKKRFGFCSECATYFGLPRRPARCDKRHVERYLDYKKDMGLAGERVKAEYIPRDVVLDKSETQRVSLKEQSSLRTTQQGDATPVSNQAGEILSADVYTPDPQHVRLIPNGLMSAFSISDDEEDDSDDVDVEAFEMETMLRSIENINIAQPSPARTSTNDRGFIDITDASMACKLLSLDAKVSETVTTDLAVDLDELDSVMIRRSVPKLVAPRPCRKGWKTYQAGQKSLQSPTGFEKRVRGRRRQSFGVPCPPPPVVGGVFTGRCNEHQGAGRPRTGCRTCELGIYLEAGVPTPEDEEKRRRCARSAPPILIRTQTPASKFECAVQTCFCDLVGDKCLTCREREKQAEILGARFF